MTFGWPRPPPPIAATYLLVVDLWEGRHFPVDDQQRLFCTASFNGETRQTGLGSGTAAPVWNARLEWAVTAAQLRSLEAGGSGHCKLTFAREDGRRVGWVVCDLRAAKLNAKHSRSKPAWLAVAGPFRGKSAPEVLLHHSLLEQPQQVPEGPQADHHQQQHSHSLGTAATGHNHDTAVMMATGPPLPACVAPPPAPAVAFSTLPLAPRDLQGGAQAAGVGSRAMVDDAHLLQQAGALSQGMLADSSLRRFEFSVDLRSFHAGRRLPLNLASLVVQLTLPQDFAGLLLQSNGRLPPQLAPLRTQPPVAVARGSEAALPGGQASVQFTAGLMSLATLLARNPVMGVEVWHRERLAEDTMLGRAHIPLSPLLQESWVDGRAGVFAMLPLAGGASGEEERVQVGTLHLVMSLEEVGPAPAPAQQPPSHVASPRRTSPSKALPQQLSSLVTTPQQHMAGPIQPPLPQPQQQHPALAAAPPAAQEPQEREQTALQPAPHATPVERHLAPAVVAAETLASRGPGPAFASGGLPEPSSPPAQAQPRAGLGSGALGAPEGDAGACHGHSQAECTQQPPPAQPSAAEAVAALPGAVAAGQAELQTGRGSLGAGGGAENSMPAAKSAEQAGSGLSALAPEIEAAWELEVWKRQEEERWRAELKQREAERMAALEGEWRRREREREAEHATLRQEYGAMQARTQQVLAAVEERERKVVAAEEAVALRRRELEREHAARVGEAEAAVRRLQMEFEHQMEMERVHIRALQQAAAVADTRAAAAESRAVAAEQALQEHRQLHSRSAQGELERDLGAARAALAEAQQRAAAAGEAKCKYKEQVVRLAQEVSVLQRHLAEVVGLRREQLESEVVRLAAREAELVARREAGELGALRQELRQLQLGGGGGGGGGKGAAGHDPALVLGAAAVSDEVQRLLRERDGLLSSGAFSRDDPLIQQLDSRIRDCAAAAAPGPAAATGLQPAPPGVMASG